MVKDYWLFTAQLVDNNTFNCNLGLKRKNNNRQIDSDGSDSILHRNYYVSSVDLEKAPKPSGILLFSFFIDFFFFQRLKGRSYYVR